MYPTPQVSGYDHVFGGTVPQLPSNVLGAGGMVRTEKQAVLWMADLMERAAKAGNTPPDVASKLAGKVASYREAAAVGAYSTRPTNTPLGSVSWDAVAANDAEIYRSIVDRWKQGVYWLGVYGAPGWAAALQSEIDRVTSRSAAIQDTTWQEAARNTKDDSKKQLWWLIPVLVLAGGLWLAVTIMPAVTAWQQTRLIKAQSEARR